MKDGRAQLTLALASSSSVSAFAGAELLGLKSRKRTGRHDLACLPHGIDRDVAVAGIAEIVQLDVRIFSRIWRCDADPPARRGS